jgi:hypothetical protein
MASDFVQFVTVSGIIMQKLHIMILHKSLPLQFTIPEKHSVHWPTALKLHLLLRKVTTAFCTLLTTTKQKI